MATSRNLYVSLALLVAVFQVAQAFVSHDCCVKYTKRKFDLKIIDGYQKQRASEVCDINAIVFQVRTSPCNNAIVKVCADPKQKWVQERIEALDKRSKKSKRRRLRKLKKTCNRLMKLVV